MFWQWVVVGMIVAGAAGYLARAAWHTWRARRPCGGGCHCPNPATRETPHPSVTLIPVEQLTLRPRPAERH